MRKPTGRPLRICTVSLKPSFFELFYQPKLKRGVEGMDAENDRVDQTRNIRQVPHLHDGVRMFTYASDRV